MSKIPSFNIKSKLRLPSGFKGHHKSSENENKQEKVKLQPCSESESRPSALHERTESKDNVEIEHDDYSEPKINTRNDNVEKTSQNLSKIAEKLDTGSGKQNESSKLPQRPAFRKRTSSNSTKVSAGQAKDKSTGISTHGQSPYGKTSHLATKPPLARPKSYAGMKASADTKITRLSGIPSSGATQNRQFTKQGLQESEVNRRTASVEATEVPQKELEANASKVLQNNEPAEVIAADSGKQTAPSKIGARKSSIPSGDRFGLKATSGNNLPGRSMQKNRPSSADIGFGAATSSGGLMKRGSKESLAEQNLKGSHNNSSTEKRTNKIEIQRRNSKENLKKESHLPNQSRLVSPQVKTAPQLKPPSKELQTMAVKLRSYGGKRPQRPLSYSAGKASGDSGSVLSRRQCDVTNNIKNSNSSSMQNLTIRGSPERQLTAKKEDLNLTKPLVKARSSSSLGSEDEPVLRRGANIEQAVKKTKLISGTHKVAPFQKPPLGMVFPRSKSSSKTISSSSSEFATSCLQHGEPYQSTPLRLVSDEDVNPDRFAHPFVDEVYDDISAVFEDDVHAIADKTFDQIPKKPSNAAKKIMDTTFDATTGIRTAKAIQNDTFTNEPDNIIVPNHPSSDSSDLQENCINETFDKGATMNKQLDNKGTLLDMNTTRVLQTEKDSRIDFDAKSAASNNMSSTPNEILKNELSPVDETININTTKTINVINDEPSDAEIERLPRQEDPNRVLGVVNLLTDTDKAYCSSEFLENEAMLQIDDSFSTKFIDESLSQTPPTKTSETKEDLPKNARSISSKCINDEKDSTVLKENDVEGCKSADGKNQPRSSSRALNFEDLMEKNKDFESLSKLEYDDNEIFGISLVDDSYDLVTCEDIEKSKESGFVDSKNEETIDNSDLGNASNNTMPLGVEAAKVSSSAAEDNLVNASPSQELCRDAEVSAGGQNASKSMYDSQLNTESPNAVGQDAVDTDDLVKAQSDQKSAFEPSEANKPLENEENKEVVDGLVAEDSSSSRPNNSEAAATNFSSLLTQTIESSKDCSPSLQIVGLKEQMKVITRRRSLVRRNTSPYFTSSLPLSFSAGPNFRMPRETTISETEDGSVLIDASTFRNCQNDTKMIKTNLLRLKRILQEADVMSPFVKLSHKMASSPPNTPKPGLICRSFSDASSWLTRTSRSQEVTPHLARNKVISSNKTDQEKMEDEINNMKEKTKCLELEIEDLEHELECKNYTIKLLQTQLENQEFAEQVELLTEEKIILSEENQALREKLEQQENQKDRPDTSSLKEQFLEQSDNATKVKAGIVQRHYEKLDDE